MTIKVSAFKWVPPFAQGSVRDLRVRWALEEVGIGYEERLLEQGDQVNEKARGLQPFGQVPVYQEDGLTLFESGAIVLHIAGKSDALMPSDPHTRARMTTWMFAALNSIEPVIGNLTDIDFFSPEEEWAKLHRPAVVEAVNKRLADLSCWLDGKEYLEDRFTGADILMTTVLRDLRHTDIVAAFPTLKAYLIRCEARPAFQKALADQMAVFVQHESPEKAE